ERDDALKRMRDAERNFDLALKFRPDYSEALDGSAVVAIFKRDFEAAIRFEERAQRNAVFAENAIGKGNLGWAYYGKKDFVRAEKELREAVAKEPKFCVGRYRLAQVLFEQGFVEPAAEELHAVASQKCPIQEAYRLYGLTLEKMRQASEA